MKLTISLLFGFATSLVHAAKAPNFLIIYADDLGYTQTSVPMMKDRPELGHSLHQTPHLEKLRGPGHAVLKRLLSVACLYAFEGKHSVRNDHRPRRMHLHSRRGDEQKKG